MNKDEEKFNQLVATITGGYKAIDEIKYVISQDLCILEKLWKNQTKLLGVKKSTPTFQNFLVEYLSKTYAQVIPVLRVGRYIREQEISIWELSEIPINKMELVAKSGVKWIEDVKNNAEILGYNDLKQSLSNEKEKKEKTTNNIKT